MDKKAELKKLQNEWYTKLKQSGFEDIETPAGNLKKYASSAFEKCPDPMLLDIKRQYYQMAGRLLSEYRFDSPREQIIWEYHCKAISMRDIVYLLNKVNPEPISRTYVWGVIKKLERAMKLMYIHPEGQNVN